LSGQGEGSDWVTCLARTSRLFIRGLAELVDDTTSWDFYDIVQLATWATVGSTQKPTRPAGGTSVPLLRKLTAGAWVHEEEKQTPAWRVADGVMRSIKMDLQGGSSRHTHNERQLQQHHSYTMIGGKGESGVFLFLPFSRYLAPVSNRNHVFSCIRFV
jgi:hypothetical protein